MNQINVTNLGSPQDELLDLFEFQERASMALLRLIAAAGLAVTVLGVALSLLA